MASALLVEAANPLPIGPLDVISTQRSKHLVSDAIEYYQVDQHKVNSCIPCHTVQNAYVEGYTKQEFDQVFDKASNR